MVRESALRKIIGADALRAIAGADLRTALLGALVIQLLLLEVENPE